MMSPTGATFFSTAVSSNRGDPDSQLKTQSRTQENWNQSKAEMNDLINDPMNQIHVSYLGPWDFRTFSDVNGFLYGKCRCRNPLLCLERETRDRGGQILRQGEKGIEGKENYFHCLSLSLSFPFSLLLFLSLLQSVILKLTRIPSSAGQGKCHLN